MEVHYCCSYRRYIFCILMFIIRHSDELNFKVKDVSLSSVCQSGLLEGRDDAVLEIEVNMQGETINENRTFYMEVFDQLTNESVQLCSIKFSSACSPNSSQDCFCQSIQGDMFYFTYRASANVSYGTSLIKVNGGEAKNVKYPKVYQDNVVVSLWLNEENATDLDSCSLEAVVSSTVVLQFCTSGLIGPKLTVSLENMNQTSDTSECLTTFVCIGNSSTYILYSYQDSCQHQRLVNCSLQGYDLATYWRKRRNKEKPLYNQTNSRRITYIVSAILVCILSGLLYLVYKVSTGKIRIGRRSRYTFRSFTSSVDPKPKPSIQPIKRVTRRFTMKSFRISRTAKSLAKERLGSAV